MRVLYIGGTGDISYPCLHASARLGHECAVFNRGRSAEPLPPGTRQIVGDVADRAAYAQLGREDFDVVCQFTAYTLDDIARDLEVFAGHVRQYVFISTASAYQKPPKRWWIREDVPLSNPFWPYSQAKADMEAKLLAAHAAGRLPVTIVRPSHTYRRRFPGTFVRGDVHAWRMLNGRPVIVHGDGTALWTLTHANDFAPVFARLLGVPRALGEAYHITTDTAFTWNELFAAVGRALGVEPRIVHMPTDALVRHNKDWAGPLLGDKTWTALFDNSKVQAIAGSPPGPTRLEDGLAIVAEHCRRRLASTPPDLQLHALIDRLAESASSL